MTVKSFPNGSGNGSRRARRPLSRTNTPLTLPSFREIVEALRSASPNDIGSPRLEHADQYGVPLPPLLPQYDEGYAIEPSFVPSVLHLPLRTIPTIPSLGRRGAQPRRSNQRHATQQKKKRDQLQSQVQEVEEHLMSTYEVLSPEHAQTGRESANVKSNANLSKLKHQKSFILDIQIISNRLSGVLFRLLLSKDQRREMGADMVLGRYSSHDPLAELNLLKFMLECCLENGNLPGAQMFEEMLATAMENLPPLKAKL